MPTEANDTIEFIGYGITLFHLTRNGEPRIQIQDLDGNLREVTLAIHRRLGTNELTLDVVRHFTDPTSQAWFPDSSPWLPEERLNAEENEENF